VGACDHPWAAERPENALRFQRGRVGACGPRACRPVLAENSPPDCFPGARTHPWAAGVFDVPSCGLNVPSLCALRTIFETDFRRGGKAIRPSFLLRPPLLFRCPFGRREVIWTDGAIAIAPYDLGRGADNRNAPCQLFRENDEYSRLLPHSTSRLHVLTRNACGTKCLRAIAIRKMPGIL
jgi:hypothetical protein